MRCLVPLSILLLAALGAVDTLGTTDRSDDRVAPSQCAVIDLPARCRKASAFHELDIAAYNGNNVLPFFQPGAVDHRHGSVPEPDRGHLDCGRHQHSKPSASESRFLTRPAKRPRRVDPSAKRT